MNTKTVSKTTTKSDWRAKFAADLDAAAKTDGFDISNLRWEDCKWECGSLNHSGVRVALVFFGAVDAVNEHVAQYFEAWAKLHMEDLGVTGSFWAETGISYRGKINYGCGGWLVPLSLQAWKRGERRGTPDAGAQSGFFTSYVYYPCAE